MLNWLDNFFHRVTGTIGSGVSAAVHWALHGLASVVFAVFANVKKAWAVTLGAMAALHRALDLFGAAVVTWMHWLWKVEIPRILRWAAKELALLAADLAKLRDWAVSELHKLTAWITAELHAVYQWVIRDVLTPLTNTIKTVYQDLIKWGYYAYEYITHPDKLAELLIMPIVSKLEKYAWVIAKQLGTFILALISANIGKIAQLAEDIITAVF